MYSHCRDGGWILGNTIDGTQADFVRIPYADTSLYPLPEGADEEAAVMLSDILPTGFECGVLNGAVKPGDTVAIVGAGPVGLVAETNPTLEDAAGADVVVSGSPSDVYRWTWNRPSKVTVTGDPVLAAEWHKIAVRWS